MGLGRPGLYRYKLIYHTFFYKSMILDVIRHLDDLCFFDEYCKGQQKCHLDIKVSNEIGKGCWLIEFGLCLRMAFHISETEKSSSVEPHVVSQIEKDSNFPRMWWQSLRNLEMTCASCASQWEVPLWLLYDTGVMVQDFVNQSICVG